MPSRAQGGKDGGQMRNIVCVHTGRARAKAVCGPPTPQKSFLSHLSWAWTEGPP